MDAYEDDPKDGNCKTADLQEADRSSEKEIAPYQHDGGHGPLNDCDVDGRGGIGAVINQRAEPPQSHGTQQIGVAQVPANSLQVCDDGSASKQSQKDERAKPA